MNFKIPHKIVDNALTKDEVKALEKFIDENEFSSNDQYRYDYISAIHPILKHANDYIDLSNARYYEVWEQNCTRPAGWHRDKDEVLFNSLRIENVYPLISTIYYLKVENVVGGRLLMRDARLGVKEYITPIQNRLVMFGPGLEHYVEPYTGYRHSVMCNPWDRILGEWN